MGQRIRSRIPKEQRAQFCEANHVSRIGFIKMARMENEVSEILGRKVGLRTPGELSRYFRQDVLENAEVEYEKG